MPETARVVLVGVGNNASALVQGVEYYRTRFGHGDSPELPGIRRPVIDGLRVGDVEFVAAFDVAGSKVGHVVARNLGIMDRFVGARLPLVGDDLASHFGTSIVHGTLLRLLADRGRAGHRQAPVKAQRAVSRRCHA